MTIEESVKKKEMAAVAKKRNEKMAGSLFLKCGVNNVMNNNNNGL